MDQSVRERAVERPRGHWYEDFVVGREFIHHWGRTISEGDNALFSTLTLHFNPLYFNSVFAQAHGHPREQVNPMLVFCTVFGLSVEDLSENGGAFLGVEDLLHHHPVYPADTLTARSAVHAIRQSSRDHTRGICTWFTRGYNQRDELVIEFKRTNLVSRRPEAAQ